MGTGVHLTPSIFVVLPAGDYRMKIEFVAKEAEILRQPCQAIQLQLAMNRASDEYLYPRERPNEEHIDHLNLQTATDSDKFFEAQVHPVNSEFGKFNVLW